MPRSGINKEKDNAMTQHCCPEVAHDFTKRQKNKKERQNLWTREVRIVL
jgi:hypothetical protein